MSPELAQVLMRDIPEMKEFVSFLRNEAQKLNNLHDIELSEPELIALEVRSRKRAIETIVNILSPLLTADIHTSPQSSMKDFLI